MSDWEVDYYLKKLRDASGTNWSRDYSGNDPNKLFRNLELARKRFQRLEKFNRALVWTYKLGGASFIAGLALAVWSSMAGVDAGTAAGSLIAPGAVGFVLGLLGSIAFVLGFLDPEEEIVHRREDAYNSALQQQAGAL